MSLFTLAQYVTYVPSWRKTFLVLFVTFIMLSFLEMAADVITTVWHHLMTRLDLWVSHVDCTQTRHTRSRATQRRRQIGGFSKEGQIGGSSKEGKWGRRASMTGSSNTLLLPAPPPFSSAMIVNGLHLCQAFAQWTFPSGFLFLPPQLTYQLHFQNAPLLGFSIQRLFSKYGDSFFRFWQANRTWCPS